MKRICVYSGSNNGGRADYKNAAIELGALLAKNDIELVYGGSTVGLMGEISKSALDCSGKVIGVMPTKLFPKEIVSPSLTQFIDVEDMHQRKKTMADLSDGFIAMPGGVGTYEELFEIVCWAQLKIHQKPIGILNVCNYFNPFLELLQHTVEQGFLHKSDLNLIIVDPSPAQLLAKMQQFSPPTLQKKWQDVK